MENKQRKSSRPIKIRQKPGFVYEQESLGFLSESAKDREVSQTVSSKEGPSWLELYTLPVIYSKALSKAGASVRSQSHSDPDAGAVASCDELNAVVNKALCGEVDSPGSSRVGPLNSSTRFDFIDSFLSVSPVVLTDSSKMVETDVEALGEGEKCKCSDGNSCEVCAASGDRRPSESLYDMLNSALGKVDKLVDEVRSMKLIVQSNQNRLNEIEGSIAGSVADDSDSSKAADASVRKKVRVEKARTKKSKSKPSVEEEK